MDDSEGLNNYFAAFHLHDTFPVSVIIDDFGDLFDDRYSPLPFQDSIFQFPKERYLSKNQISFPVYAPFVCFDC